MIRLAVVTFPGSLDPTLFGMWDTASDTFFLLDGRRHFASEDALRDAVERDPTLTEGQRGRMRRLLSGGPINPLTSWQPRVWREGGGS